MKVQSLKGRTYFWKPNPVDWEKKSASNLQMECKQVLALHWLGDIVAEEQRMPGTKMKFDFVNFNKKIIIEVDGAQHEKINKFFHKGSVFQFLKAKKRDEQKEEFAKLNGFTLFRVKNKTELSKVLLDL